MKAQNKSQNLQTVSTTDARTELSKPTVHRFRAAAVFLIVVLALAMRGVGLSTLEVWRDEALTLIVTRVSWLDLLLKLPRAEDTPPLGFAIFKCWLMLFPGELGARLLSVVVGTATVGVSMAVAMRIHRASFWAVGLLAAVSYELASYSQEIRVYALLLLFVALAFLAVEMALANPQKRAWRIAIVAFTVLAAYSHAVGLFVGPMIAVYMLIRIGAREAWRAVGVGLSFLWIVLVLPMVSFDIHWSRFHQQAGNWWNVPPDWTTLAILARDFFGLRVVRDWGNSGHWHLSAWGAFVLERIIIIASAVLILAALADLKTRRAALALAGSSLVFFILMVISSHIALPNVVERTVLPGWLPIVIIMGLGAGVGVNKLMRISTVSLAVAMTAIWGISWLWAVNAGPQRHDPNASAFAWMRTQLTPADLVFTFTDGFEDLTVYRLQDLVNAKNLLSREFPVYTGKPPHPTLVARASDPDWATRFRSAIDAKEATGEPFIIWIVRKGWLAEDSEAGTPESIASRTHARTGRFMYADLRGTTIMQFVPRTLAATTTTPSTTSTPSLPK